MPGMITQHGQPRQCALYLPCIYKLKYCNVSISAENLQCIYDEYRIFAIYIYIYECRIFATYLQVHNNTCSVSTSAEYLQCTGSVLRTIPKFAAIIWATAPGQLSLCAGAELSNNNALRMSSGVCLDIAVCRNWSVLLCVVLCPCCKTQCGCSAECRYCVDTV